MLRILFNLKLREFKSVEAYVTRVMTVVQQIVDISITVEDEFLVVVMLNGLPSIFYPMLMALENSGVNTMSTLINSKLLQENIKFDISDKSSTDIWLVITTQKKPVNLNKFVHSNQNKFSIKCFKFTKTDTKLHLPELVTKISKNQWENANVLALVKTANWYKYSACRDHKKVSFKLDFRSYRS